MFVRTKDFSSSNLSTKGWAELGSNVLLTWAGSPLCFTISRGLLTGQQRKFKEMKGLPPPAPILLRYKRQIII